MIVEPFHFKKTLNKTIEKDEEYFSLEQMKQEANKNISKLKRIHIKDKVWNKGQFYVRDFKLFSECGLTTKQLTHIKLKPKFQLPKIKKEFYSDTSKPYYGCVMLNFDKFSDSNTNNKLYELKGRTINKSQNCYFNPKIKQKHNYECSSGRLSMGNMLFKTPQLKIGQ